MSGRSTGLLIGRGRERRVPLRGRITRQNAAACIARLVVLAVEGPRQPIIMQIESPGGSISESLSILSTMNGIKCPVATFCSGTVGGVAAIIAAHGLRGFRTATPDSVFWFKPLDSSWLEPDRSEAQQFHQILAETLARDTRKQVSGVLRWLREGAEFGAQQAFGYGLIDYVSATAIVPPSG